MKKNSILLAVCCCALTVVAGCAAPGAPQPPSLRIPMTVDNLSATRKGERVILTWSPPGETTDHQTMRWPTTTRICRMHQQISHQRLRRGGEGDQEQRTGYYDTWGSPSAGFV